MREMPDNSVDSVVTDPPYGLNFMGKKWDYKIPDVDVWKEVLRVLKPGGHALIACGTRTQHRMAVNIEDAGFEIRDIISWVHSQGFPKSLSVGKAIDKAAGREREVVGTRVSAYGTETASGERVSREKGGAGLWKGGDPKEVPLTGRPATAEAEQWDGWGSALKPAVEFFTLARKPLIGTIAENVLKYGTGGINVDGCRIGTSTDDDIHAKNPNTKGGFGHAGASIYGDSNGSPTFDPTKGRWPANFCHDGSPEVLDLFPETTSGSREAKPYANGTFSSGEVNKAIVGDSGSAARFFYCAKTSKKDRGEGNNHPTVKPTALMAYLCRLITPPGGTVLDPFLGSGSTGKAAVQEGFDFIGIELERDYIEISNRRVGGEVSPHLTLKKYPTLKNVIDLYLDARRNNPAPRQIRRMAA